MHRRLILNKLEKFLAGSHQPETFNALLHNFLKKKAKKDLSPATISHLFRSLIQLSETVQNKPIHQIKKRHLKQHTDKLNNQYSPGTIRPIIGDIRQFFRWCKKKGHTQKNIAKNLKKPRQRRIKIKAANETDVVAVINQLAQQLAKNDLVFRDFFGNLQINLKKSWTYFELKYLHDLFVIVFLYESGCRAGELTNLSTSAMDRATKNNSEKSYVVTSWGKTADRDLRFTKTSAEIWHCWKKVRPHESPFAIYSWRQGGHPDQATTDGISKMIARRCKQTEVKAFRAHSLRHAKVKRSRQLVGIELASQLIDHSEIATTYGYANIDDCELHEAVIKTGIKRDIWAN